MAGSCLDNSSEGVARPSRTQASGSGTGASTSRPAVGGRVPRHRPPPARIPRAPARTPTARRAPREAKLSSPAANCWGAAAFSTSTCTSSRADPMCSISRDPRRDKCTICTAVAPTPLHRAHIRGHQATLRTEISAQLQRSRTANPQVTTREVDKGQIVAEHLTLPRSILGHADPRYNHPNKHKSCLQILATLEV